MAVVEREGERGNAGEEVTRDGEEPRGRLYGSNRSSVWAGLSADCLE